MRPKTLWKRIWIFFLHWLRWLNPYFAAQIQIPNPNNCFGCGYKGLAFCRNNAWLSGKHEETHSTKTNADKSAKNTPNATKFTAQIVCPSSKVWNFDEKRASLGVRSLWQWASREQKNAPPASDSAPELKVHLSMTSVIEYQYWKFKFL